MALETRRDLVARAAVGTRVGHTGVLSYLAGLARVAVGTGTTILIRLRVHAGAAVHARLVSATVIQIFVTQQASPVALTATLPGYDTGPVNTAWVGDTLVTELALPAIVALAFPRD